MKKNILVILVLGFLIVLVVLNLFIMSQIKTKKEPLPTLAEETSIPKPVNRRPSVPTEMLSQREWLDMNREYRECVVYADQTEIARYKISVHDKKMFDLTGALPDATVPFEDINTHVKGTVSYQGNKRHGKYLEYFDNGKVSKEIAYYRDILRTLKEYFYDGRLRMEVDYTDAIFKPGDAEVGVGKVYARDGVLKYEWNLTNRSTNRYKKSYNIDGRLTEVLTFDAYGNLLERNRL
ncbi:MAG TPA: hypothetical protein P5160_07955 [Candidatus Omnitrophota bacterium]|nr:hypothetical protein [Candidatus Omnitrophota bacterium]